MPPPERPDRLCIVRQGQISGGERLDIQRRFAIVTQLRRQAKHVCFWIEGRVDGYKQPRDIIVKMEDDTMIDGLNFASRDRMRPIRAISMGEQGRLPEPAHPQYREDR